MMEYKPRIWWNSIHQRWSCGLKYQAAWLGNTPEQAYKRWLEVNRYFTRR